MRIPLRAVDAQAAMIVFHRVLIATAIVFCAIFAFWSLITWLDTGRGLLLVLSVSFLVASGALGYYLVHLRKFLRL